MAAIHQQGRTAAKEHLRTLITHVGVSDDQTAFGDGQTRLDPTGTANNLILAATNTSVDGNVDDYTINVTSANFGGNFIYTIGAQEGSDATDNLSRSVRTNAIGVETAGDDFTVGVRLTVSDQSP